MQSIRFRLAVYYALALTGTMVAFGAAVYWERTAAAPGEAELRLDASLKSESDFAARVGAQAARAARRASPAAAVPDSELESVRPYFEPMADYVFLASPSGQFVYL